MPTRLGHGYVCTTLRENILERGGLDARVSNYSGVSTEDGSGGAAFAARVCDFDFDFGSSEPRSPAYASIPPKPYRYDTLTSRTHSYHVSFFKRPPLAASNRPCLRCYMKPEYQAFRQRWIDDYRAGHPGCKVEDVERLSGVRGVAELVGLVNVAMEMERMESRRGTKE